MAKKKKAPDGGPNNAYLISFGDTMTALLAFFIVLNSLAEEQTGANLYSGTGSFVRTGASFRLPGSLPGDSHKLAVSLSEPGPLYVVAPNEEFEPDRQGTGPDDTNDTIRIVDREREEFERFVNELDHYSQVKEFPEKTAEVVFDYFNKLNPETPRLNAGYRRAMGQILPIVFKKDHRVEIIVWAGSPKPSAWSRAAQEATDVARELTDMGNLNAEQLSRLSITGKPWIDSVAKRPVMSIVINRVEAAAPSRP